MKPAADQIRDSDVRGVACRARQAARLLAMLSDDQRRAALLAAADHLVARSEEILAANMQDLITARQAVEAGAMTGAMLERLKVRENGVAEMASRVRQVASLPDPIGQTLMATELDDGLTLYKISCPLGVIGIVFESRPDVIPQVASLALRSGNAVILKGGAEAAHTNQVLVSIWRDALERFTKMSPDVLNLLHTREDVAELLTLYKEIDLIIPRGSRQFVRHISETSDIPVLGHGEGICYVYVDRAADMKKALDVSLDSKVQYPAACNAMETLLVHHDIAEQFLPEMIARFQAANVEVRGCSRTVKLAGSPIIPASDKDWATEYSDLIVSIKVVASTDEAIEHIRQFGSGHTESIVTENRETAKQFMDTVDAASVFHNASTRFADGYRYGLGAELGISTSKLHARGPVGLEGLTTYKYKLIGNGHTVDSYEKGERSLKHRSLDIRHVPDGAN